MAFGALVWCYISADTIIELPERPQFGYTNVKQLPDSLYIDTALRFVTLTETYSPESARVQFAMAKLLVWKTPVGESLVEIETGHLSQRFEVQLKKIRVDRYPELDRIEVTLPGEMFGSSPCRRMAIKLKLTNIPRNVANEYGVVVTGMKKTCESESETSVAEHRS